jgi:hypothetical protein
VAGDPWGDVSASVYDTARLVSLTPNLQGDRGRLAWLCGQQSADGSWGPPDGYALVPTLSATEALLSALRREADFDAARLAAAAGRGLAVLRSWLESPGFTYPDTIAIEFIAPALIEDINAHRVGQPLPFPPGLDPDPLLRLRAGVAAGHALPSKLWASLEAFGPRGAAGARASGGAIGASASATAAYVGAAPDADPQTLSFLTALQARGGGTVPGVTPITYFEQSWALNSFGAARIAHAAQPALLDSLDAALGEYGVPAAPGLPPDSDDTAAALFALAQNGRVRDPGSLMHYRTDGYFRCFSFERTPSISTNAHILEALGGYVARRPGGWAEYGAPISMVTNWLRETQDAGGSWLDKWHASAYYATSCCVLALAAFGDGDCGSTLERAARWVLETQRADGSWGRWGGTIEETAYAVQILSTVPLGGQTAHAVAAGCRYLAGSDEPAAYPGLWHAKDLYAPVRVVQAARLAALEMGARQFSFA